MALSKSRGKQTISYILLVLMLASVLLFIALKLSKYTEHRSLASDTQVLSATRAALSIDEITNKASSDWEAINPSMSFGITEQVKWLRTTFSESDTSDDYVLEFEYPLLDSVSVWFYQDGQLVSNYEMGDALKYAQRPLNYDKFMISLPSFEGELVMFTRIESSGPLKAKMKLWSHQEYISYISAHRLFMGVFFGYMIAMCVLNLCLWISMRTISFAVYATYVLTFTLIIASIQGLSFRFLWPENIWLQERSVAIFSYLMMGLVVVFSRLILELNTRKPRLSKILKVIQFLYFGCGILSLLLSYSFMLQLLLITLLITIPILLYASVSMSIQGSQIARYFSAAWGVLLLSGIITSADTFQWFDFPIESSYMLMVGAIIETLLLALALALSFNAQRQQNRQARLKIIESEKAEAFAKDELLRVQQEAKEQLEYAVDERTLELEIALRELNEVNNELETLSSIDPLTGLINRRSFDKRVLGEARRSRRERTPMSIAMLDIDHFKLINDQYGHQAGDECLRQFAKMLKTVMKRPSDVLCRFGGEEFIIILPNTTLEGAANVMEKVRQAIEQMKVEAESSVINFTVSIGVTSRVVGSDTDHQLMVSYADKQLYSAKETGRNKVVAANF